MLAVASAQLSSVNIDQVVRELAQRFEQIRNDGLGVNALEVSLELYWRNT